VLARCDELARRILGEFKDRDPFHGLVQEAPQKALAVLAFEARRRSYPERYWSTLLNAWPKTATAKSNLQLATAIGNLPAELVAKVKYPLTDWVSTNYQKLDSSDRKAAQRVFDHTVEALTDQSDGWTSGIGKSFVGGIEIPSNRMGFDHAINAPSGKLAEALINTLSARKRRKKRQIPPDIRTKIERLLSLSGEGRWHAITMLAHQLVWLDAIDPDWTKENLRKYFDPSMPDAEAAWSGFVWAHRAMQPRLFRQMKGYFLDAFPATRRWRAGGLADLAHHLVLALNSIPREGWLLSYAEARNALRMSSEEVRIEALVFLRTSFRPGKEHWDELMVPFFREVWPREQQFQTAATTSMLLRMLEDADDRFPAAVRLVANYLVPSTDAHIFVSQFGSERRNGHADLTVRYPRDTLFVLGRIVAEGTPRPPYGLGQVLSRLIEAGPELRQDPQWQRLHQLTLT
jgi:hypothetical protein